MFFSQYLVVIALTVPLEFSHLELLTIIKIKGMF